MTERRPLALVTGASSGIGFELARLFVENGYDVLANAEDGGLVAAVERLGGGEAGVSPVRADVSTREGVQRLWGSVIATGRPLDAVVLNAGVGAGGAFLDTDLDDEIEIIDLNVRGTVHLAKLALRDMATRDDGKLLITSSIASTMPGSFQAVYNASKSFLQSFALALQEELKETGITITSLMPGPTRTNFFERAGMADTKIGQAEKDDPAQVAEQGFEALMKGKAKVVAGSAKTKAQGLANKALPDSAKAAAHRRMAEPGSGEPEN